MELLRQFGVEPKLLIAQVANFLVLLFVLWKFVYRPVLKLLQERSDRIARGLKDAEAARSERERIKEIEAAKLRELEKLSEEMIASSREDAKARASEIMAKAEEDVRRVLEEAKRAISLERAKMFEDVRGELVSIVLAAAEQILRAEMLDPEHKRRAEEAVALFMRGKEAGVKG